MTSPSEQPLTPADTAADLLPAPTLPLVVATVLRALDALSRAFWVSIMGMLLAAFLAGLASIETGDPSPAMQLGEYAIPKSILPPGTLLFGLFMIWLTGNRLRVLERIIDEPDLEPDELHRLLELNPAVVHLFDRDNYRPWLVTSGLGVLTLVWGLYFGFSLVIAFAAAVERGPAFFEFSFEMLALFGVGLGASLWYARRGLMAPLGRITTVLHGEPLRLGWQRTTLFWLLVAAPLLVTQSDQFDLPGDGGPLLLGPALANAVDGETIFLAGVTVKLFGIDAPEPGQQCLDADDVSYACGRAATIALQHHLVNTAVLCNALFTIGHNSVVGACERIPAGAPVPSRRELFDEFRSQRLSSLQVEAGHALAVGVGAELFADSQQAAQAARRGIWRGAFEPPWLWRERIQHQQQ